MSAEERKHRSLSGAGLLGIILGGLLAAYFGLFGLLLADDIVFRGGLLRQPLERYSPDAAEWFKRFVQTIYAPIVTILRQLGGL